MYGYGQPHQSFGLDPLSLSSLIGAIRSAVSPEPKQASFRATYTQRRADREIDREDWLASRPELADFEDIYSGNRSRLFD